MDNITFRRMEIADTQRFVNLRISQLKEEGADTSFDIMINLTDFFKTHLSDETFVGWIAIYDNKIIATSGMSFCEKPPYYGNPTGKIGILSSMYTIKEFRRKGIAKKLIGLVVNEAKEYGCGTVYITASSQGALLYENIGFIKNENFFQLKF